MAAARRGKIWGLIQLNVKGLLVVFNAINNGPT